MIANIVIGVGIALAAAGILLLIRCIRRAAQLRASEIEPGRLEAELRGLILMNGAAVGIGFFGIAVMIVGMMV